MILALDILLAVSAMIYMVFVVKRDLQMLQQNSYRNERYKKWLDMNGEYTTTSRMGCMVIGLLLMTSFAQFEWFGVV